MDPVQALVTVLLAVIGVVSTIIAALLRGDVVPRKTYEAADNRADTATVQNERNIEALAANNALLDKMVAVHDAERKAHERALSTLTAEVRSYRAERGTHGLA